MVMICSIYTFDVKVNVMGIALLFGRNMIPFCLLRSRDFAFAFDLCFICVHVVSRHMVGR